MASQTMADTDARQAEYSTYAPAGSTCANCKKPIKSLAPVRRIAHDRSSAGPAVSYRHTECPR